MYRYLHRVRATTMRVRFEFRKSYSTSRAPGYVAGSADGKPVYDGSISVVVYLQAIKYGPYASGIRANKSAWDGRKARRVGEESHELVRLLTEYHTLLEEAHQTLSVAATQTPGLAAIMDGQALMGQVQRIKDVRGGRLTDLANASGASELVSLIRVHAEFLVTRKALIEKNRKRRRPDQISAGTYRTYENRWVLISSYLTHLGRLKFPVLSVNYPFAESLRTYLLSQEVSKARTYDIVYVNKVIGYLKMLLTYAQSRSYVESNVLLSFSNRGGSRANPKPLSEEQMAQLETMALSPHQRHICDSWLVAAELCLHYADYMELPLMKVLSLPGSDGRLIVHDRNKQNGTSLVQTVDVTPRAERLLAKWGGPEGLYRGLSASFSKVLKQIAKEADLRTADGEPVDLQFGMGRDTGLTSRAIEGATDQQLKNMGGWSKAQYANHYIGNAAAVVAGFVREKQKRQEKP